MKQKRRHEEKQKEYTETWMGNLIMQEQFEDEGTDER
jgi:hypothetical protein